MFSGWILTVHMMLLPIATRMETIRYLKKCLVSYLFKMCILVDVLYDI